MKSCWIINGQGHLAGRLASLCAKELLIGTKIIVLKCEKIEISGKHIKNKLKFLSKSKKKMNTNPKRGPFHFHSPSQIFWKIIRGMLPHKTKRGTAALMRFRAFDGNPSPFHHMKKFIIPSAFRITTLSPGRKYSILGEISNQIGWTKKHIIESLIWNQNVWGKLYQNYKIKSKKKNKKFYFGKIKYIWGESRNETN
ncbi:60S ribosomal protein L13A (nucleomorph) [Chroomonas mesostigmatica CCMP1168]|uniref:60S ribosomal protein L13A n=1 Tax=Chroomonas mesostigmatica CCMP1168 TaxID=1195612 RepID=J7G6K8_9CRYP|nr:60S ribosomal protein L13A [Chroomonas mesostigmatica CCMP1168]